jgi:hypothetical protein
MKQVTVIIGNQTTRVVNANEYSVTPKTNGFKMVANDVECDAWSTSGKGKSAVNNHYLYWREGKTLFWFKSSAEEIVNARTAGFMVRDGDQSQAPAGEQEQPAEVSTEAHDSVGGEQPAASAKRVRVRK